MLTDRSISYLLPELLLIAAGTLIYLLGAFRPTSRRLCSALAVGSVVLTGLVLWKQYHGLYLPAGAAGPTLSVAVGGPLVADLFGQYARALSVVVGLVFVLASLRPAKGVPAPEYWGTLLMATAGSMLVGSARDLVLLFAGLELLSIPTYVLLYLGRRDVSGQEATVKYFYLSLLSSAFLLYGFSFLYGIAGSTDLGELRTVMSAGAESLAGARLLARVALVLVFAGLGFRIAAVPFHFYAPDVYQGTSNGNAGFLAVFPKIAGFVALVRVLVIGLPGMESFGWRVAMVVAVLTMSVGNLLALWQDNLRRLLAYSSIAHAGYMLVAMSVALATAQDSGEGGSFDALGALVFYLTVYVVATAGTFAALAYLGTSERQIDGVDELAGVGRTHPWAGLALAVFMFSLAGIPPLAGFWGKLTIFGSALGVGQSGGTAALGPWFTGLAVIGVLNAAVAAAYYLRIVSVAYFRAPATQLKAQGGWGAGAAMLASALLVVMIGCWPSPWVNGSLAASEAVRATAPAKKAAKLAAPAAIDTARTER